MFQTCPYLSIMFQTCPYLSMLLTVHKSNMFSNKKFLDFSKNIQISCMALTYECSVLTVDNSGLKVESSIYQFRTILVAGDETNLFYDNDCGDSIATKTCADRFVAKRLAALEIPGPIDLWGVNNQKSVGFTLSLFPLVLGKRLNFMLCVWMR